jgi:hypothetical protein
VNWHFSTKNNNFLIACHYQKLLTEEFNFEDRVRRRLCLQKRYDVFFKKSLLQFSSETIRQIFLSRIKTFINKKLQNYFLYLVFYMGVKYCSSGKVKIGGSTFRMFEKEILRYIFGCKKN